jgi:Fe2+ or Zn2+ uptake regulation protein
MIDYDHKNNHMLLECDTCGEIAEFDGDYKYCISEAKRAGWKIVKKPSGFHHYCSEGCKNGFRTN